MPTLLELFPVVIWFTKLNLRGTYNLVQTQQGNQWKTAFGTLCVQYKYLIMLSDHCNAL